MQGSVYPVSVGFKRRRLKFMMIFSTVLVLFLCRCGFGFVDDEFSSQVEFQDRSPKFFPFFLGPTQVRVANTECTAENGLVGTCYSSNECSSFGGKPSGTCSKGFGRCCVLQKTCGWSTNKNCTYFVSPDYPTPYFGDPKISSVCSSTVWPCPGVCQLRLDFIDFNLAGPDANGNCLNDFFLVTGGGSRIPRICGLNTGEHVYVDFLGDSPIVLTVDTDRTTQSERRWNIKVTQIKCCHRAPVGCLMHYTATSGKVMSFNYSPIESTATSPDLPGPGTRELANLNYGVCIEMSPGYCSIEWSQNPNDNYSFTVSNDTDVLDPTLVGQPDVSVVGSNCTGDYIIIPNPMQNGITLPYDRFCGNALPTVTSSSKPFVLTVVTNNTELGNPPDVGNRGFCLNYRQLPCAT